MMTKNSTALTEGKVLPALLNFTMPFFFANLLQTLYGTVDTLVVGNFGSTASVSAVSCGAQLLAIVTYFILGLTGGATVLVGQFLGAGEKKQAGRIIGVATCLFIVLSVIATGVMLLTYKPILSAMNVPPEAMEEAVAYTMVCVLGIPLIIGYNGVCAILRGMGDSKSPLYFVAVACVVNIFGDLLLTGYLGMGALGVAIATVFAQGVSFVLSLVFIWKKGLGVPICRQDFCLEGRTVAKLLQLGIPMALQSILVNLSFLLITAIINAMGVQASAAMGVGDKIVNFAFLPLNSFANAVSIMVAQNAGAGKIDRCKKITGYAILSCLIWAIAVFAFCQMLPTVLPSLFTKDAVVQEMTGLYVSAYSIDLLVISFTFQLNSMFTGFGHSLFSMVQSLIATFLFRVPITWLFSEMAGVTLFHIGLACPLSSLASLVMCLIFYKSGKWKKMA